MRIPNEAHTSRPWRIHDIAHDFDVEDVWALPTPGGPDDFERLVMSFATGPVEQGQSPVGRLLMAARWKLGEWFGWDRDEVGLGRRVRSLRDTLPADLRDRPAGPELRELPFTPLYCTNDEWAAELANGIVHAVLHVGWVEAGNGGYRGQMAVLVRPNGLRGRLYMAAIKPFRYAVIYPALMRDIDRQWTAVPA